ncbi:coniferyl aldehyde dehydrogenase [Pseudomaricurvus alkylphenolicus]|uniref:coniferyl aldehyde dehydrogenase n=1 Tax=Pseudomaricurvus alkylphenolicus TaxID=1306991 RepID=UPI00141FAC01|nr:coniferyl aldehyde dehydrogenase [Pseudomaricurvus alkylphenolicus]NIB43535.1 coniferyl aldehyde dehydrogenase [Pseudomaricurvus alkylphenolicus]
MSVVSMITPSSNCDDLGDVFQRQKTAFDRHRMPSLQERIRRLDLLHNAVLDYQDRLIAAVNNDFGNRSQAETRLAEIFPILEGIHYCRKNLKRWMKPQRRKVPLLVMPASVQLVPQPVGVVGIVVPWNFPIFLGLSPLLYALAAGNHAMLKMSEFAPQTGELMCQMLSEVFPEEQVAVFNGDVEVATRFTNLPFDHLVFTGSTQVGRTVMRSAAENLTPVTLELGGKSPAIIHREFPVREAAKRIAFGKSINAGQVCVSPDYVLCPREHVNDFCREFIKVLTESYPTIKRNKDYTAIITERQRDRLKSYVRDAREKGAQVMEVNPAGESFDTDRKLPMTLLLNVNNDMKVMQDEIFGPLLPVLPYDSLDEALAYVNGRDRPLALYYFDWDGKRAQKVLENTHSGGACVNDTMSHVMADDIPFGGVGPSGIGQYHGREGFETFSNLKGVVKKGRLNASDFVGAPWDRPIFNMLVAFHGLKFRKRKIKGDIA